MQEEMRFLRFIMSAACIAILAFGAACVLNPWAEFRRQAEEANIGRSFSQRTAKWGPPLSAETTARGTTIYGFRYFATKPNWDCILFFEVSEDTIVAAWHKGKDCVLTN